MPTSCAAVVAVVANAVEMLFPQDQGMTGLFKDTVVSDIVSSKRFISQVDALGGH